MIAKCLQSATKRFGARCMANVPWKMNDYYYNYQFTEKLNFIDHTVRFPLFRVMDLEGKIISPEYETLDKEFLLKSLGIMVEAREMDAVYNNAQRQNRITFYMTGTYEEGANVAAASAIKDTDALFLQYREFPMLMKRGYTPMMLLHNIKGNSQDNLLGKCFPLMNANPEINIFSTSAPLGNRHPHSAGAGYYFRVKGMDKIACCVFGEGAASEGDVHASMNFAATLGCQTLFYCRNNAYAISTFRDDQYAGDGVAPRGIGYGMPAIKVDGSDFFAVFHAVKQARELIMKRKGPVIVEAYTYRGGDHSTSDSAASYRTKEKMATVNNYIEQLGDPILRLGKYMQNKGMLTDYKAAIKEMGDKVRTQCLLNLKVIDEVKMPPIETMFEGVYKDMPWNVKEQRDELREHLKKFGDSYPIADFLPDKN
jgi:2-oxoisovalerate dehydrogenase E1 component alpha subunit